MFKKLKLSEICQIKYGKDHKSLNDGEIPAYGTGGIIRYVDSTIYDKESVLIPRKGTLNSLFYVDEPFWTIDTLFYTEIEEDKIVPKYFYYYLKTFNFQEMNVGTAVPSLTVALLNELELDIPSIKFQKKITRILSYLDNKIENNNAIISNLEEQAQAIFKSWFIDFEPFQDGEFVDSELGKIPKGWEVRSLYDIADFKNGLAMQKYRPDSKDDSLPVLKIKELRANSTDKNSDRCIRNIQKDVLVIDGDVIFSWSGSLLVELWTGGKAGLNQHLFKVTSNEFNKWFYFCWTKFFLERFQVIARDRATTMGHIKISHLKESKVLIPNKKILNRMDLMMNPIIQMIINLGIQNRKIGTIRDTLLPKLMSGEIRVGSEELEEVKNQV